MTSKRLDAIWRFELACNAQLEDGWLSRTLPCVDRSVLVVVELENWFQFVRGGGVKTKNGCDGRRVDPCSYEAAKRFACLNVSFLICPVQVEISRPAVMCTVFHKHYTWCELEAARHGIPLEVVPPLVSTQTCEAFES